MSKVLPILFNTEMVRAILEGRKTVTRRLIKPQPTYSQRDGFTWKGGAYGTDLPPTIKGSAYNFRCAAPYQPGDILYVQETWLDYAGRFMYKADCDKYRLEILNLAGFNWYPSIHMPKEAARIWLKVKDVRVERLQEIDEEQARKEGCQGTFVGDGSCMGSGWDVSPVDEFSKIWNSTIKKSDIDCYGWDANPWVWVIEFERCEKPED